MVGVETGGGLDEVDGAVDVGVAGEQAAITRDSTINALATDHSSFLFISSSSFSSLRPKWFLKTGTLCLNTI